MEIEVVADPESAARAAARLVAAEAREAAAARGQFTVAFSGGHTPWVMLRALADEDVPWDKVHVCSTMLRFIPITSMQCRSKNTISLWRLANMTTCCKG
jgi:6-phosphogluconolactonase